MNKKELEVEITRLKNLLKKEREKNRRLMIRLSEEIEESNLVARNNAKALAGLWGGRRIGGF